MIIPVKVKKRIVTCKKELVEDNVDTFILDFTFDDMWDGFSKRVIFYNDGMEENASNPIEVFLENPCTIPWEVLQSSGNLYITIEGTKSDTDEVIVTQLMSSPIKVNVSGKHQGSPSTEPTPSVVTLIINTANEAKKIAQSVRDDADSGKFNGAKGDKGEPGKDAITDKEFSLTSQNAIANYVVTKAFANGKCKGLRLYNSLTDLRTMREELTAEDEFFVAFTTVDKVEGTDADYIGTSIVSSNNIIDLNSTSTLIAFYNLLSNKPDLAQLITLTSLEELGTLISNPDSFPFIAKINFKPAQSENNLTSLNEDADLEQGDFVIFYDIQTTDIIKKSTLTQIRKPLNLSAHPTRRKAMPRKTLMALGTGMYEVFNEGYIGYSAAQGTIYCPRGSMIYIDSTEQTVSVSGDDYYYIENTEDLEYWRESFAFTRHDFNSSIVDYSTTEEVKSLIASAITGVLEGTG